jgi:flagellar assembly protein FliH
MSSSPDVRELVLPDLVVRAGRQARAQAANSPHEDPSGSTFAAGFAAGYAEGLRRASEQAAVEAQARAEAEAWARAEHAMATLRACEALTGAADRLGGTVDDVVASLAHSLTDGVVRLAEAVVGSELGEPGRRAAAAVQRVLAAGGGAGQPVRIRMNPQDTVVLDPATVPAGVVVLPDPDVKPGDALADAPDRWIDARVSAAIARAADEAARADEDLS